MNATTDDRTLVVERQLAAPPDRVFDAWTNPKLLVQWWGPEGMTTPDHDLDVREGGAWTTTMMNAEGGRYTCSGVYTRLERPGLLAFTWAWKDDSGERGPETEVTVTLEAADGGTRMKLVQKVFETVEARDSHRKGWESSFNKLERFCA